MKKIFCLLAGLGVLLSLGGCQAGQVQSPPPETTVPMVTPSPEPTPTPKPAFDACTYEVKARVCDEMPEYRFVASGVSRNIDEWYYGFVTGLNIYDQTGAVLLSADFSEGRDEDAPGNAVYQEMMDTMGLHVTDVNFDGYQDVIILEDFAGAHGNTWYHCWLWDPEASAFTACPSFEVICNPALNREQQCIYSAGGCGASCWGGCIYKFIDGEFVLTNDLDADGDGVVETALVDGQMEIVRQVVYEDKNEDNVSKEQEYYKNSELWQLDHPRWYMVGGHHADQWLE